jgi:predicted ATP-dependent endonuclease of OLD family
MILIEDGELFVYEELLKNSLTQDFVSYENQIDTAIKEWDNTKKRLNITTTVDEDLEKQVIIYKAIELSLRMLSREPEDVFETKAQYYAKKYDTEANNVIASLSDRNDDGESDTAGTIFLKR